MRAQRLLGSALSLLRVLTTPTVAFAQASRLSKAVRMQERMEPPVSRPEQEKAAAETLAVLRARSGKRPNLVWLLLDDMGWGDPGAFEGGAAMRYLVSSASERTLS